MEHVTAKIRKQSVLSRVLKIVVLVVLLGGILSGLAFAIINKVKTNSVSGKVFNTTYSIETYGFDSKIAENESLDILEKLNNELNSVLTTSKIYYLNNTATVNEKVYISKESYDLFVASSEAYISTSHKFNPAILPVLELYGLDPLAQSNVGISEISILPTEEEISSALEVSKFENFVYENEDDTYYVYKTNIFSKVDFTSCINGYALDLISEVCAENNLDNAYIQLGSNVYAYRTQLNGSSFTANIISPLVNNYFCQKDIKNQASSNKNIFSNNNYYNDNANRIYYSNIINGSNGEIVTYNTSEDFDNNQITSATTISASGFTAEVESQELMCETFENAYDFATTNNIDSVCINLENGQYFNTGESKLTVLAQTYIEYIK